MFIEGAHIHTTATMWYIYIRLACLSRSVGSFLKEEMTTETKTENTIQKETHLSIPQTLNLISVRFGAWSAAVRRKQKTRFPVMKKTNRNNINNDSSSDANQVIFMKLILTPQKKCQLSLSVRNRNW